MKIVEQSYEIMTPVGPEMLKLIELAGRTCYKSEDKITEDSAERFCKALINRGHESVLEHASFSVRFITDRGISHEIVRHRLFSFSQESTRYVKYDDIEVIRPPMPGDSLVHWVYAVSKSENAYKKLICGGCTPEIARSVLPTCLKTELVVTGNIREWRHFLKLRIDKASHPQIRELATKLLHDLQSLVPVLFDDIGNN